MHLTKLHAVDNEELLMNLLQRYKRSLPPASEYPSASAQKDS
jgi:hypothetical protein